MGPVRKIEIPKDRVERLHFIKRLFPNAKGPDLASEWAGGRLDAVKKLNNVDAIAYGRNHHFSNGSVTHLSPYLRHGCITLNEVVVFVKIRFGQHAEKLLLSLASRDYWRRVWFMQGNAILSELEPPKVAIGYQALSSEVKQGNTGLPCMDGFIADLFNTGYVHNHARMWLASYIVHHLKIDWREAADWFEAHLLDGDIASNHLSWQWVASTFSTKPYFFNKEILARYTGAKYCATCQVECPFDDSNESLNERLLQASDVVTAKQYVIKPLPMMAFSSFKAIAVFVHDEMLCATNSLMQKPFPKFFIFDRELYGHWSLNRLQFVADCLSEMVGVEVWVGSTHDVLMHRGVGQVITQDTPNLRVKEILQPFSPRWEPPPKFIEVEMSENRLKRFSRYWEKLGPLVLSDIQTHKS